ERREGLPPGRDLLPPGVPVPDRDPHDPRPAVSLQHGDLEPARTEQGDDSGCRDPDERGQGAARAAGHVMRISSRTDRKEYERTIAPRGLLRLLWQKSLHI